jgi:hypothetical protein
VVVVLERRRFAGVVVALDFLRGRLVLVVVAVSCLVDLRWRRLGLVGGVGGVAGGVSAALPLSLLVFPLWPKKLM